MVILVSDVKSFYNFVKVTLIHFFVFGKDRIHIVKSKFSSNNYINIIWNLRRKSFAWICFENIKTFQMGCNITFSKITFPVDNSHRLLLKSFNSNKMIIVECCKKKIFVCFPWRITCSMSCQRYNFHMAWPPLIIQLIKPTFMCIIDSIDNTICICKNYAWPLKTRWQLCN